MFSIQIKQQFISTSIMNIIVSWLEDIYTMYNVYILSEDIQFVWALGLSKRLFQVQINFIFTDSMYILFILQCQKAYTVLYFNVRKLILFYTSMSENLYCFILQCQKAYTVPYCSLYMKRCVYNWLTLRSLCISNWSDKIAG